MSPLPSGSRQVGAAFSRANRIVRPVTREALIAALRNRVEWDCWPRLTVTVMLAFAGLVSFLSSVLMLRAGLDSMASRYGLAALVGYAAFLAIVRLWIAAQRGSLPDDGVTSEIFDVNPIDAIHSAGSAVSDASFDVTPGFSLDLDDLFMIVLILLLVLGGVFAVAYVVYAAPALLAEVMLDAALVASVSARLKPHESQWWASGVLSRTVLPASALVAFVSLAGYIMAVAAPEARSIGGVVRQLFG